MLLHRGTVFTRELANEKQELTREKLAGVKKSLQTQRYYKAELEKAKERGDRSDEAYLVLENAYGCCVQLSLSLCLCVCVYCVCCACCVCAVYVCCVCCVCYMCAVCVVCAVCAVCVLCVYCACTVCVKCVYVCAFV